jgi:hypothetical protein
VRAEYPNQLDYSGLTCDAVMGALLHFLVAFVLSVGTLPRDSNPGRSTGFAFKPQMTPAGLEPAIPGSVGRCLIHWATGPLLVPMCRVAFAAVVALRVFLRFFLVLARVWSQVCVCVLP